MLRLSRRLDDHLHVVRYDRRGYGRSAPHGGPFGIREQVEDLVEHLDGRRAVIVGHSFGGNIALAAAERHPELVAGVATYETPVSWLPWWPRRRLDAPPRSPADEAERFIVRLIGDERWLALPERTREVRRTEGTTMVAEAAALAAGAPWEGGRIHVPVAVGLGAAALDHHRRAAAYIAAAVDGAELVVLAGCGHDAPTAASDLVAKALVEPLLRRVGPPWSPRSSPA